MSKEVVYATMHGNRPNRYFRYRVQVRTWLGYWSTEVYHTHLDGAKDDADNRNRRDPSKRQRRVLDTQPEAQGA